MEELRKRALGWGVACLDQNAEGGSAPDGGGGVLPMEGGMTVEGQGLVLLSAPAGWQKFQACSRQTGVKATGEVAGGLWDSPGCRGAGGGRERGGRGGEIRPG